MPIKKKGEISIGHVSGDVTISQDQKGGKTLHSERKKIFFLDKKWKWRIIVSTLAAIATVLTYFGISPNKESIMSKDKKDGLSIGKIEGNAVISQNQSGGITAHTININEPNLPEIKLAPSERIGEGESRLSPLFPWTSFN